MTVTLNFHGAAGTVTGSCYRVVHPGGQFLVDCGMFQGNKTVRDLNYTPMPVEPLYTMEDAQEVLQHRVGTEYGKWVTPGPGVRARYWNAGHILGSASIEVEVEDSNGKPIRILFSGDLGPDVKVFWE